MISGVMTMTSSDGEYGITLPSSDKVSALKMSDERLGSSEANKNGRVKVAPYPGSRWPILDTPRRRSIDRGHGDLCFFQRLDDSWEGLADFARETEA